LDASLRHGLDPVPLSVGGRHRVYWPADREAIRNAQVHVDGLLVYAFLAERLLEIYALKDGNSNLFFDAGYIHPDVDRNYAELRVGKDKTGNNAALVAAYTDSWGRLLQRWT